MELSKFIQNTIQQIIEGVSESQQYAKDKGAVINPSQLEYQKDGKSTWSNEAMPQEVEFDVGLTSTTTDGSTEGVGVFLGSINLGKKNQVGNENTAITKVKFTIPVILPPGDKY